MLHVELNRPEKLNTFNEALWKDMGACFTQVAGDAETRVVLLSAAGKVFTAGLDLADAGEVLMRVKGSDIARKAFTLRELIARYQASLTAIEKCPQPVIAAVHSACVGAGVDLITACDIRWCTSDTFYSIKEVDVGLAADVGTLQRLPKVVGNDSLVRELAYTARRMDAAEAARFGLVSRVCVDQKTMMAEAMDMARVIAAKSPVAVSGTKVNLNYSRDHGVDAGLDYIANWNAAMLQTDDLAKAVTAFMKKEQASFPNL